MIDVVAGNRTVFASVPSTITHCAPGKLKALGVGGLKRNFGAAGRADPR